LLKRWHLLKGVASLKKKFPFDEDCGTALLNQYCNPKKSNQPAWWLVAPFLKKLAPYPEAKNGMVE
jgi:hypothetical protein